MFRLPASPTMQATWPHDAMIPGFFPGIFYACHQDGGIPARDERGLPPWDSFPRISARGAFRGGRADSQLNKRHATRVPRPGAGNLHTRSDGARRLHLISWAS